MAVQAGVHHPPRFSCSPMALNEETGHLRELPPVPLQTFSSGTCSPDDLPGDFPHWHWVFFFVNDLYWGLTQTLAWLLPP